LKLGSFSKTVVIQGDCAAFHICVETIINLVIVSR